ncbi:MAG: purine-nucleoside phosphorylase [Lachnospiraceae bacterium]|nr:purine-nucleoside phosphorylase [Lachnospiraceae bacterium]
MLYKYQDYQESCEVIRDIIGDFQPETALILGSGLGFLADEVEAPVYVPYNYVPHFKGSTAPGHKGRFVFGKFCGKNVVFMQGRLHCYEGYEMEEVAFPIRVMKLLGAEKLVLTNAAGCVNREWNPGDIMLISDHIRLFGFSPLTGPNIPEFGTRFNDQSEVYDAGYRRIAAEEAEKLGITLREGVYMFFPGPSYETPAEVRAARVLGADAVGMSTIPEAIFASHAGMKILGFSLLSNMAAGVQNKKLSEEEVLEAAQASSEHFSALVRACIPKM